jgi:3-deoxy-D-manno-octulosonic-acid transferase
MRFTDLAYDSAIRTLRIASPALARGDSKLARGLRGRRGAAARLIEWARVHRDPRRPLIWLHAPSVGEGLQARAVHEALGSLDPEVQTVFTHFSPSAEALAKAFGADVSDYLPWDDAREMAPVLEALRPDVLSFTKTEVWPVLTREAETRGTGLTLIGATLPRGSSRLSPVARPVLRPAFARLAAVHAVAAEDSTRFALLGVPAERVIVTGDPGIDSAAQRAAAADPEAPYLRAFLPSTPRIVAGSTWAADEAVLLPAFRLLREGPQRFQIVIAPHEPDVPHVRALLARLREEGWQAATLADVEGAGSREAWDAVVVDRVGVLAHLYTVATVAYVGGGFHDKGLHSVLEPAAAGVPVCFGPRHHNAHAAEKLVEAGGARVVAGAGALFQLMEEWLGDEKPRRSTGEAARAYIDGHRGAARRSAELLLRLIRAQGG